MMERIKNWLRDYFSAGEPTPPQSLRKTGNFKTPNPAPPNKHIREPDPEIVAIDPGVDGTIESLGPGKNVLIRTRFVREDTGTHETLKILDDSIIDTGEETGIDPYNTGGFDRSKKWDQRFRK